MDVFWKNYIGPGKKGSDWRASPLHTPKSRLQKLRQTPVHLTVAEVHSTHLYGVKTAVISYDQSISLTFTFFYVIAARDSS